jgi:hypothetical protein
MQCYPSYRVDLIDALPYRSYLALLDEAVRDLEKVSE